jgi:hypothetical protein
MIQDEDAFVRYSAVQSMGSFGPAGVPHLAKL